MGFEKAGLVEEITSARPKRLSLGSYEIVLFRKDNEIFAIENLCPHQLMSVFHQSTLDGYTLTCPMHGWSFDVRSGKAVAGSGRIKKFEVEARGKEVWIKLPEAEERFSKF
jgi:nitrite reductase (NADH) small subunit